MGKKPNTRFGGPSTERAQLEVIFDKPHLLGTLFGQYDRNLVAIENRLGVYIAARGNKLQIEGEAQAAARARLFDELSRHCHPKERPDESQH